MHRFVWVPTIVLALVSPAAATEWRPAGLHPAAASLSDVLAAHTRAVGTAPPSERRERWTYTGAGKTIPVEIAVRGDDFRARMTVGGLTYEAGRLHGDRWRADGNGITHLSYGDLQGDALDRLPQSLFAFDPADCTLAGETSGPSPAWVVADRPPRDRPHWFFVDEHSGEIVREITREGKEEVTTTFDDFRAVGGTTRPRAWHVRDGNRGDNLDVVLDAVEADTVAAADVAPPAEHRTFAAPSGTETTIVLPSRFRGKTIWLRTEADGQSSWWVLDTGSQSVMVDVGYAARSGFAPALEHTTVPRITVGALTLTDASVLTPSLDSTGRGLRGILGLDFFEGHVVHIDYAKERVEIASREAVARVFADPRFTVMPMNVAEGLPLVSARLGTASGSRFALDTGSSRVLILDPFIARYRAELDRAWPRATFGNGPTRTDVFLEGSTHLEARNVPQFDLGPVHVTDAVFGFEIPNGRDDAIAIPFDGVVGADVLDAMDLWFDYDRGLLAARTTVE